MTLAEILANEELRHREFPVTKNKIFLAHGGVCALPRRVAQAINDCANEGTLGDQEEFVMSRIDDARRAGARLLNCQPDEVSLVGPTSLALSYVAAGLNFRKGDNILIYHDDYPSNVYPWMALAAKGVKVRLLNIRTLGIIRKVDVMGQVDEDTRLVALASNHFISGHRLEHDAIGQFLRERGILFCLDAIQTLGAFPTTVENVDFLAADAHKWLLGPCGAGVFYVKKDLQEKLNPPVYGWHNVRNPDFVAQDKIEFRTGAAKFEAGTHNLVGLVGLLAAMELALEIGVEEIARELLRKRAWLVPALQAKGYTVLNAGAKPENVSGITAIHQPGQDMAVVYQKLADNGVVASLRTDRKAQKYLRLSPHFYNTDAELHRLLELL
ncbi:MAG: aminotransferase class V-fold PLP-dependent enzyme [Verrucomicrobiae bacterium]|nr:aminotransferase class V-fold PLP-dependent enzyme [Verrucomicrobiae bacterium]